MNGDMLQQIRSLLLARRTRIGQSAKPEFSDSELDGSVSAELIDVAQALEQVGRDTTLKEAERRELAAIERALAKMKAGSFGVCEDCDDEIPPRRLMVVPEARLCANCQMFEEKQNAKLNPRAKVA